MEGLWSHLASLETQHEDCESHESHAWEGMKEALAGSSPDLSLGTTRGVTWRA